MRRQPRRLVLLVPVHDHEMLAVIDPALVNLALHLVESRLSEQFPGPLLERLVLGAGRELLDDQAAGHTVYNNPAVVQCEPRAVRVVVAQELLLTLGQPDVVLAVVVSARLHDLLLTQALRLCQPRAIGDLCR